MLSYRPEIDGLRAIAVCSVILYHSKMVLLGKDWFEGGFIGVDIFFVISGYLITRIILSELQTSGSFSFLDFYERRARRILPMFFVVIFISMPFAWQKLLPTAFVEYAESILASLFFVSNFFFYFSTTEYGAESALLKPFLHTWSLGVEEQFYIIFPIIAILAYKFYRNRILTVLLLISLLSLLFSEFMVIQNSDLNFYLPFSRFWELAVGSMLAYRELNHKQSKHRLGRQYLPTIGLFLVLYSISYFDGKTPHPSLYTLIPVLGVGLIIGFSSKDELVGKILGSKPFVGIGLISYSAYLWHFPIFAYSRMGKDPSSYDKIEWIAVTFALSVASYFLIEKKFRSRTAFSSRVKVIILLGVMFLTVSFTAAVIVSKGFEYRISKPPGFENYEIDNEKLRKQSWSLLNSRTELSPNFSAADKKVLLVGNSHAKDLYNALVQNDTSNHSVDFLRGSLPQIRCANEEITEYATVRNRFYSSQQYKEATSIVVSTRYGSGRCEKNKKQIKSNDFDGLRSLIKRAKSDGKFVIVFGNTAEFDRINNKWVADYSNDLHRRDGDITSNLESIRESSDRLLFSKLNDAINKNSIVESITISLGGVYFDKVPLVCDLNAESCSTYDNNGFKNFYDYGHWTLEGASLFGQRLLRTSFLQVIK